MTRDSKFVGEGGSAGGEALGVVKEDQLSHRGPRALERS
jgi:hypothetical protein